MYQNYRKKLKSKAELFSKKGDDFHSFSILDSPPFPRFLEQETTLPSLKMANYSMSRTDKEERINDSAHSLELVVFGVLHRSCYGVSFGSRQEFTQTC